MDLYTIAVHEAGHAVASVLWGRQVEYITIAPRGEILSECNNGELLFDLEDSQEVNGQRPLFRESENTKEKESATALSAMPFFTGENRLQFWETVILPFMRQSS